MGIEEALKVLSERGHRGSSRWRVVRGRRRAVMVTPSEEMPGPGWLNEFEAVAIAEAYERGHFEETKAEAGGKKL